MTIYDPRFNPSLYTSLIPPKRKVFISYHHAKDQWACDTLRDIFSAELELFTDRSLREPVNSENMDYVNRWIRENQIKGTSITIVLCGEETNKRKCVDWELYSTLYYNHALLGLVLPSAKRNMYVNEIVVPSRLAANVNTGYAEWAHWNSGFWAGNHGAFLGLIESAISRSKNPNYRIDNSMIKMTRNAA